MRISLLFVFFALLVVTCKKKDPKPVFTSSLKITVKDHGLATGQNNMAQVMVYKTSADWYAMGKTVGANTTDTSGVTTISNLENTQLYIFAQNLSTGDSTKTPFVTPKLEAGKETSVTIDLYP